jgi:hypothetical protein
MIRRQHIEQNFFGGAQLLRDAFEERVKDPYGKQPIEWHYFCEPGMFTYLCATVARVIPQCLLDPLLSHLKLWCISQMGLIPFGSPNVHLMVNGCTLGLHSDFHNGAWGYVYSLTLWDNRQFVGGETLLVRDGVPSYKKHHVKGPTLYELFPARFNQLLVFDDSIVHGTPIIQGGMDPLKGRIALVGHLRATSPLITGPLDPKVVKGILAEEIIRLRDKTRQYKDIQGTVSLRVEIGPSGIVESVVVLADSVITAVSGYEQVPQILAIKSLIQDTMQQLRFPAAPGPTTIVLAILIPIPDLRRIEVKVENKWPTRENAEWIEARRQTIETQGLRAAWDGSRFRINEPVDGTIEIGRERIEASFDAPMWVPSQRHHFEIQIAGTVKALHDIDVGS